jgi:hypothetical protein
VPTKPLIKNASTTNLTLPAIGAAFGASGPYANYVLLTTIPADEARQLVQVQNFSTGLVVIVFDDGTTASGSVPAAGKATAISLAAAAVAGGAGGGVFSDRFQGRVQVYAPLSTAQVAAFAR